MTRYYGPCMCGATDCPSCGPAQGYEVIKVWDYRTNRWKYINPDPDDDTDTEQSEETDNDDDQ